MENQPDEIVLEVLPAGATVPAGRSAALLPAPAPAPIPPEPAPAAADPYAITTWGAVADGGQTDSAPAFYRMLDAGLQIIRIPPAPKGYGFTLPILIDRPGVTIEGVSPGASRLQATGNNGGPCFVVGVARLSAAEAAAAAHRPPATALDASAAGGRTAIDTLGTHTVAFSGCPFQLGYQGEPWQSAPFDYWAGDRYTIEVLIEKPPGATWSTWEHMVGFTNNNEPTPWSIAAGPTLGSFLITFQSFDQPHDTFDYFTVQGPPSGPWRLSIQRDAVAGTIDVWINGKAVEVVPGQHSPGPPFGPGKTLKPHNGIWPLVIGSRFGPVPNDPANVTPLRLHGLNVTAGLKYVAGAADQVALDGLIVDDRYRYFAYLNTPAAKTIGFLKLDDPAATWVAVQGLAATSYGLWIPAARQQWAASETIIRDLSIQSLGQPGIMVGESLGLTVDTVHSQYGAQGVGPAGTPGIEYVASFSECTFGGGDAAMALFQGIVRARNIRLAMLGREGVRAMGTASSWYDVDVLGWGAGAQTIVRSVFDFLGFGSGQAIRLCNVLVDNETGVPARAFVVCEQAPYVPSILTVDGLLLSQSHGAPLVLLTGPGIVPGAYSAGRCRVNDYSVAEADPVVVVIEPGAAWSAVVNGVAVAGIRRPVDAWLDAISPLRGRAPGTAPGLA